MIMVKPNIFIFLALFGSLHFVQGFYQQEECHRSQYQCDNLECVDTPVVCDGIDDCADGSDEKRCGECQIGEFECKNHECISTYHVCNQINDCEDLSDEENCGKCLNTQFQCHNLRCIERYVLCDKIDHCGDRSDENYCGTCGEEKFRCRNRNCIEARYFCNGVDNCGDNSDEWERYCYKYPRTLKVSRESFHASKSFHLEERQMSNVLKELTTGRSKNINSATVRSIKDFHGINNANKSLHQWFLNHRRVNSYTTNKWGLQVSKIASALYLSDAALFSLGHEIGNELRYELSIQVLEKLSEIDKISTPEMASFMNGLLVTCLNQRDFHGFDLVAELRRRVDVENYTNPFEILALCNANDSMTLKDIDRIKVAYSAKKRPAWIDTQAVATLAMSCIHRKTKTFTNTTTTLLKTMIQELKASQKSNGSIGSVKDTALVLQALIATNDFQSDFNISKAINSLLLNKGEDGSFGSFLNSYYILPVFNNKSLVDIDTVHCQKPSLSDTEALDHLKRKKGEKLNVRLSIVMGKNSDFGKTWSLKVPENSSLYEVIELVSSMDAKFITTYNIAEGKPFVSAVSGIEDDLELGRYWFTYLRNSNSSLEIKLESPTDAIIEENQEFVLWYKEGNWRED